MSNVRTGHSGRVKQRLDASEAALLLSFMATPAYQVVLDILESTCVMQETDLMRVDVKDEAAVMENFKLAKSAWTMFERFQLRMIAETQQLREVEEVAELTEEQRLDRDIMEILDPTKAVQ